MKIHTLTLTLKLGLSPLVVPEYQNWYLPTVHNYNENDADIEDTNVKPCKTISQGRSP